MLGFKGFLVESDEKSLMAQHSKMVSSGYERAGSVSHPSNGRAVHVYRKKGSKDVKNDVHLHTLHGSVHKTDTKKGEKTDYAKLKSNLHEGYAGSGFGAVYNNSKKYKKPDPERNERLKKTFADLDASARKEMADKKATQKEEVVAEEEKEKPKDKKLLKEKPKRGDDGKLEKSKSSDTVKDCIKMSGKKEKIDTEPVLNNLTTTGSYNL